MIACLIVSKAIQRTLGKKNNNLYIFIFGHFRSDAHKLPSRRPRQVFIILPLNAVWAVPKCCNER